MSVEKVSIRYADLFVLEPVRRAGAAGGYARFNPLCGFVCFGTADEPPRALAAAEQFQSAMRICLFWNIARPGQLLCPGMVSIRYADLFVLEQTCTTSLIALCSVSIRYADLFVLEPLVAQVLRMKFNQFQSAMRICLFWNGAPAPLGAPATEFQSAMRICLFWNGKKDGKAAPHI